MLTLYKETRQIKCDMAVISPTAAWLSGLNIFVVLYSLVYVGNRSVLSMIMHELNRIVCILKNKMVSMNVWLCL